jgi:hypothetical protein
MSQTGDGVRSIFYQQSWSITEGDSLEKVRQRCIPLVVQRAIRANTDLLVSTSRAALRRQSGEEYRVGGFLDTRVAVISSLFHDLLMAEAGLNVPTGKRGLSNGEAQVLRLFAAPELASRVNRLGEGLDVNLAVSTARKIDRFNVGLGLGYLRRGAFRPLDGEPVYRRGSELTYNLGIDYYIWRLMIRGDWTTTRYGSEQIDKQDEFKLGARRRLAASLIYRMGNTLAEVTYFNVRWKKNQFRQMDKMVSEHKNSNGAYRVLMGSLRQQYQGGVYTVLMGEYRDLGRDEAGKGGARVFGFGAVIGRTFYRRFNVEIGDKLIHGESKVKDLSLDGQEYYLGLEWSF